MKNVKVPAGSPALQQILSTLALRTSPLGFYGHSASVFWCQGYVLLHRGNFWVSFNCCSLCGCISEVSWQQYSSTVLPGAKALKMLSNLVYKVFLKELISQGWWRAASLQGLWAEQHLGSNVIFCNPTKPSWFPRLLVLAPCSCSKFSLISTSGCVSP